MMAVDMKIGAIETRLSATDPATLQTPQFMARVVAMVKQELQRESEEEQRRRSDRQAVRGPSRRR
jgi:hypothetical protein